MDAAPASTARVDRLSVVAAAIPVAVVLALLVPFVDVDPVVGVTASNSPFTDEAWSVLNARNWALFGAPSSDEWGLWVLTVPFTVIDAVVFRLFGVGIVQARLVDIACVAITAGLLGVGLRRPFGAPAALVSGVAYGTSALILFYGRMAYLEPMAGMFLTAGVLTILSIDGTRPGRWGVLGGLSLALAAGTKATVLPTVIVVVAIAAVAAIRLPTARRWAAGAGGAVILAGLAWLVLVGLPNREAVTNVVDRIYPRPRPFSLRALIGRALLYPRGHNDHALRLMAPVLIAGAGGTVVGIARIRQLSVGTGLLLVGTLGAFVVGFGSVAVGLGAANRYVVFLIPLLGILAAPLVAWILERLAGRNGAREPDRPHSIPAWLVAGGLAILLAAQGVALHAAWMRDGTRTLVAIQAEAARTIPPGTIVAGGYAGLVAMTAPVRVIVPCCGRNPVNAGDLYAAGARIWANLSAPTWASAHQAAWDARRPSGCLTWSRSQKRLCLEALP
jgi:hypothetical protein